MRTRINYNRRSHPRTWVFEIATDLTKVEEYKLLQWVARIPEVSYVNNMLIIRAEFFSWYFSHMREFVVHRLQLGMMGVINGDIQ